MLRTGVVPNALRGRFNSLFSVLTCLCQSDDCLMRRLFGPVFCRDATAALTTLVDGLLAVSSGLCLAPPRDPDIRHTTRAMAPITRAAWAELHSWW